MKATLIQRDLEMVHLSAGFSPPEPSREPLNE